MEVKIMWHCGNGDCILIPQ